MREERENASGNLNEPRGLLAPANFLIDVMRVEPFEGPFLKKKSWRNRLKKEEKKIKERRVTLFLFQDSCRC